ncbi:MAG TPA: cupin domain-containing protein [Gemmatimonadaceae bacterium]
MNVTSAPALAAGAVANRPGHPATTLAHDCADARVVLFRIEPGQEVTKHTTPSTVVLTIVSGRGIVSGAAGDRSVRAGDIVAYERDELHGMRAEDEQFVVAAVIAPRPAAR